MKKLLTALLSLSLICSLAACGGTASAPASASIPAQAAAPSSAGAAPAAPSAATQSRLEQIKAAGKITMATSPSFAPYEFEDLTKTGQAAIVGSDIELGKAIAAALGVELKIEKMEFATIIGAVQANKVDFAISGFAYKPERAEQVGMAGPYNSGGLQGILLKAENAGQYKSYDDFAGKKIAAQNGSIQADLVTKYIPKASLEICTNVNEGIMLLKTGKVDALAIAEAVAEEYIKNYNDLGMSSVYFTEYKSGTYAICNKDDAELLEFLQKVVTEKDTDGSYEKWLTEAKELAQTLQK